MTARPSEELHDRRTSGHPLLTRPASGPVVGTRGANGVLRFPGIQYATAARFQEPQPLVPHADPVDASRPGPICPQLGSRLEGAMGPQYGEPRQSEDCLYLSVVTPALTGDRPVMVWLHGGGFLTGAGTLPWYDGSRLAADGDVVVVSVNYRVGAFGYLLHEGVSNGNLGLLDQVCALEWIRANIGAFGGDPDNITVFGQSAGALSAIALLSAPAGRGLIRRAIVQSSPSIGIIQERSEALEVGEFYVGAVGGDPLTVPVDRLLDAQLQTLRWSAAKNPKSTVPPFSIVRDRPLGHQDDNQRVLISDPMPELMIGYTSDECRAFAVGVQDEELVDAFTTLSDSLIIEPSREMARDYSRAGGTVYSYEFAWAPDSGGYGAIHCLELPFLLGTAESWRGTPMLGDTPWGTVERAGKRLRSLWAEFARSGAPSPDPDVWPAWRQGEGVDLRIDLTVERTVQKPAQRTGGARS